MPVKTTILLEEQLFEGLRRFVQARYGTSRKLSEGIGEAVKVYDAPTLFTALAAQLGLKAGPYPSSAEIKQRRVPVTVSAGAVVRKLRDARAEHLSRLQ